jgi:hypothetical protein
MMRRSVKVVDLGQFDLNTVVLRRCLDKLPVSLDVSYNLRACMK